MAKILIKKSVLMKAKRRDVIGKGIVNGRKVVAMAGAIGDWAGYVDYFGKGMSYEEVARGGAKIYTTEIDKYFKVSKDVKERYRR